MSSRLWVDGSDGNIYAATSWSPFGSPQPGDSLYMVSGTANMHGGNLSGDLLIIGALDEFTTPAPAIVNLSGYAVLNALVSDTDFTEHTTIFNIAGIDSLYVTEATGYYATTTIIENIASNSILKGTFAASTHNANITINGQDDTAKFQNAGASTVDTGIAVINADIIGVGSFATGLFAEIEFAGSVGLGQTIHSGASSGVTIDRPDAFHGLVDFEGGTIQLQGLSGIDSYTLSNDLLSFFAGGQVVDTLRFADAGTPFQVTESAAGIQVSDQFDVPPGFIVIPPHGP